VVVVATEVQVLVEVEELGVLHPLASTRVIMITMANTHPGIVENL
jgi:hypothetical protein